MKDKPDTRQQAIDALLAVEQYGTITKASKALGIPRTTLSNRIQVAEREQITLETKEDTYVLDELPEDDIPVDEIINTLTNRFKKRKTYVESKEWRAIKMKSNAPIGLLWLGDPHVDDNYCDWETLRRHVDIIQKNKNIYGCGLGDYQNNWVGRLGRLYGEQDTSHETAWKLVEWLINSINPLILIGGNHDMWSGSGDPLKWMTKPHTVREDWEAKIEVKFPNGKSCFIHAAHDMKGHSQWNPLHAQQKMAMFKNNAHLYIAGHRHNWALANIELVEQKMTTWLARARGYKYWDTYALVKGFDNQNFGQAILQVINPQALQPTGFCQCFVDVETGAEYLNFLEQKFQAGE